MDSSSNFLMKIRDEIDKFLSEDVEAKALTQTISNEEEISISHSLDELPWKKYPSGNGAWIFSDIPGAEGLYQKLMENKDAVQIGEFWYKFKMDGRFIAKFPIRKKRNEA